MSSLEVKVLDHGYIKVIESWGSDERIIEAARMSTDKGFLGWGPRHQESCAKERAVAAVSMDDPLRNHHMNAARASTDCDCETFPGDEKLLKYLADNHHDSPFEFAGIVIEVQAPIFVFREWQRHRSQSYNEMSARYTPLPDVNYVPSIERLMMNAGGTNKQAGTDKGAVLLTEDAAREYRSHPFGIYANEEHDYQWALKMGVPKELARIHLPVGRYSRMRACANLRNWLAFLTLRSDKNPGAQWEIRRYANALGVFLEQTFPRTMRLFNGTSS